MKVNIEDPDSSEILYPARFNNDLDWDTINKLAENNPDFKEFLKRITRDLSIKEIREEAYDKVFTAEKLMTSLDE